MGVGDQPGHQVDQEVVHAAVAGVVNLRDVFQLVVNGLDDGPLAQQQLVHQGQQSVLHVLANRRDELHSLGKESFEELMRDIPLVSKALAEESFGQLRHRLAVIDITSGQKEGQDLALVIDHQMEFEAVEPAHRALASSSQASKHPVALDTSIVADSQRCGIDEGDAADCTALGL